MTEDDVRKKVLQLLRKIAPDTDPTALKPDDNIRQALGIDSFDYLSFIVAMDEELNVQTPEQDYGKIGTLNTLIPYILGKRPSG